MISNFGMGSVLVNYYRKKDEKDDYVPKVRLPHLTFVLVTEGIFIARSRRTVRS